VHRRLRALTALAAALTVASSSTAATANAATSTTCTTGISATFTPGLGTTGSAQTVAVTGKVAGCSGGVVSGGKIHGSMSSANFSCAGGVATGHLHVRWNTGATSSIHVSVTLSGTSVAIAGKVKKGLFVGDTAGASLSLTGLTGNCTTSPVTAATFTGTFSA
jgi:hypothetical protein